VVDYYTNYYRKGQTQLFGFVTSWHVLPYPPTRRRERGKLARKGEVSSGCQRKTSRGWDFRSPQTVLKTVGPRSTTVHLRPLEFDRYLANSMNIRHRPESSGKLAVILAVNHYPKFRDPIQLGAGARALEGRMFTAGRFSNGVQGSPVRPSPRCQ
jgi:hypothetical protein